MEAAVNGKRCICCGISIARFLRPICFSATGKVVSWSRCLTMFRSRHFGAIAVSRSGVDYRVVLTVGQVRFIREYLIHEGIDLVYDRGFHMSLLAAPAVRGLKVPRIATIVSPPNHDVPSVERNFVPLKRWLCGVRIARLAPLSLSAMRSRNPRRHTTRSKELSSRRYTVRSTRRQSTAIRR